MVLDILEGIDLMWLVGERMVEKCLTKRIIMKRFDNVRNNESKILLQSSLVLLADWRRKEIHTTHLTLKNEHEQCS